MRNNMEAKTLTKADLQLLQEYNKKIYPDKVIPAKDYLDFWLNRNDRAIDQCLILREDDGSVHGQVLASEMSYYYKQERIDTVWLFDLIVDEELRKSGWGVDVLLACMDKHPLSCSTGSGPTALPIHMKMGNNMLGEIRKYVGLANPLDMLTSPFRGNIKAEKFPASVTVNGKTFHKLSREKIPVLSKPYNDKLFEIARDKEFLQWRYFNNLHPYAFYKDEQSNDYFVVRTTIQKHITVMLLVDYRCNMSDSKAFETIFKATKKVMNTLHIGMLIAGSSLKVVDDVLEAHGFKSIGRHRPVIGFVKVKDRKADVEARQFLLTTFADSDGETNWV